MIKDVFVLRKNSWHMKLMKWIWNLDHRDFSHICPYFWMSVLNLIMIVPFSAIKLLIWCLKTPFSNLEAYLDRKQQASFDRWLEELKANPEKTIQETARMCDKDWDKYEHELLYGGGRPRSGNAYYDKFSNELWNKIDDARTEYRQNQLQERYKAEIEHNKTSAIRRAKINSIIRYVKPVAMALLWIIMSGLALLALWGLYHLVLAISEMRAKYWIIAAEFLGVLASVALGIVILYQVVKWLVLKAECSIYRTPKWVSCIGIPFKWLGTGIVTIWDIISTMVANSCPYIDWKEDK